MEKFKSPEEARISIREALSADSSLIERFLGRRDIDSLFVPPLSDPVRGTSIRERVEKKFRSGTWTVAIHDGKLIGCMAIIPAKLAREVEFSKAEKGISEGVSLKDWSKSEIWELSTVVVDRDLCAREGIKGVGGSLLEESKNWVMKKGKQAGLVTDSWIGGDMGGFVAAMNARAYGLHRREGQGMGTPDTILRIFEDPAKRGEQGPPTVVYGIPLDAEDWRFFELKQPEIKILREIYERLEERYRPGANSVKS
ncbi:hypothetical protein C4587_02855 [Candidatus Parcubacteria bacterium]|nr:MAG: hypothetical protein C4587_02855 [Candidatus Parcubacteria bacterium]